MLDETQLKNLLHKAEFSSTDKVLLCLAVSNASAKSVKVVKELAFKNGLRVVNTWNVSSMLGRSKGRAVRVADGWELTSEGRSHVASLVGPLAATPVPAIAASLRVHLPKIVNCDTRDFVEEGIECFERQLHRSAVVLTWVGAIAVLQDHVVNYHLGAFNAEAARRDKKWANAKTADDLGKIKEYDFLQILERISVLGKNVKQELEKQLRLRNGCGHPNSLRIADNTVAAHIEVLVLNVFTRFT